jgi:peroxiredoxin
VYEELGDEVTFLMVNLTDGTTETVETASAFIKDRGFTFPVLYDVFGEAAIAYGIRSIPMTIFIDSEGNYAAYASGALDEASLRKGINLAMGK